MPSLVPADPASERALKASPLVPTLSFAALGLATMVAIGTLGLAQHPSADPDVASPSISVRPPDLTLAGAPADARAVAPEVARVTPVVLPRAGSLRTPASVEIVVPVVDPSAGSSAGSATRSHTGSAQEVPLPAGRGARLAAGQRGKGAAAGSSRNADGAARPVAAARKPSTSSQPVPVPKRRGPAPVESQRTTAPAPKPSTPSTPSTPQGSAGTPAPGKTSVVPGPSPVQGPLLMAARPRGVRLGVAQVPTTIAPPTPVPAKKHQRSAPAQEQRSDGQSRDGKRGSGKASGASHKRGHRTSAPQHAAKQDRPAKHEHRSKQDRQAKQSHQAKRDRPAKHEHRAKQHRQVKQSHRAGHGHGRTHRG